MRFWRGFVVLSFSLMFLFSLAGRFLVWAAPTGWNQSNWSDGSFSGSSNVITSQANTITLATNTNWFDNTWKYRQSVTVSNTSGSTLTDYQIPLFLNTATLITGNKMKADCGDLRITDASGTTLPYWIATSPTADICGQTNTKIWVKANALSTSGTTLYLYYGNADATTLSNGTNVFSVFADFTSGSSLPTGWTKTDIGTSGTATVDSGKLTITNTNGPDVWVENYGGTHVYNNATVNGSFIAETLITSQANSDTWAKSGLTVQNAVASGEVEDFNSFVYKVIDEFWKVTHF